MAPRLPRLPVSLGRSDRPLPVAARDLRIAATRSGSRPLRRRRRRLAIVVVPLGWLALSTPARAGIDNYGLLTGENLDPGAVVEFSTLTNTTIGSVITVGAYPKNAVFSPDGRYAYVVNAGSNSVTVLDVAARTIVATIGVGNYPNGIAISPDGQYVYATGNASDSVSVISTATNQVVGAAIPVGSHPYGVAVSSDGSRIYVANLSANSVSVIDAATRTVIATVSVGIGPSGISVSPDGSKVYVANQAGSVSVIDTATHTVVATISLSGNPLCIAVSPDGTRVYVTDQANTLFVINSATNAVTTVTIPNLSVGVTVTPDGSRIYVSGSGGATVVDAATNTVIDTVSTTINSVLNGGTGWIGPNVIVATGGAVSAGSDAALTTLGFDQYVNFNGGTLKLDASFSTAKTISLLALGGVIDTNGFDLTLSGTITNNGMLTKAGAGILTLTGTNTYTGGTLITGGLINFNAAANFGTGLITLDGGGLQWATGNTTDISARLTALGSNGGTFDTNGNDVTFASGLTGTGGVTKAGAGTLTLGAVNTYTGATIISGGTLALTGTGSIAASRGVSISSGATFDISGTTAGATITTLAGLVGSSVALGGETLTLSNASSTFAGQITGTGGLVIAGGTEALTGASTYTGGTTVASGTLVIGNSGAIGTGPLVLAEGTTLGFTGGSYTIANAISISGDPAFAPASGTVQTLTGVIADGTSPGTLEMVGAGTLVLAGTNTYTGATIVAAGTLALSGTGTIAASSGVSIGTGATFDISATTAGATITTLAGSGTVALGDKILTLSNASSTFAGVLTGTGGLALAAGVETLTGTSTYTGATTIDGGLLVVSGAIASSATTVNRGGTLTGTGTVGSLTVNAGGVLAPGAGTPGSTMTIAGTLAFAPGSIYQVMLDPTTASRAVVGGAATLAGTVQAYFASGSYLSKNYTILSAASRTGTFDALATTNLPAGFRASLDYSVAGSVMLDLSLNLDAVAGLSLNQRNVAVSLGRYFNGGGALPPGFVSVLGLTGQNLANALTLLSGEPATGAQQGAFQMMTAFLGLMVDPFVDGRGGAAGIGAGGGGGALGYADADATMSPALASAYAAVFKAPAKAPAASPLREPRWTVWGSAYGGYNRTAGDPAGIGSHDLSARADGFAIGADYRVSASTLVGFALAGGGTGWSLAQGLGSGKSDAFQAGVYGKTVAGPAYLAVSLAFAEHWMSTDRISVGADHLTAAFDGQSYGGRIETGWRIASPVVSVTPYAAVQAQAFTTPGYRESDTTGGSFGLAYAGRTATDTRGEVGSRFDHALAVGPNAVLALRAKLAYAHDWVSDPTLAATFLALPGAGFTVTGATPAHDSALASAGAELRFAGGFSIAAKFDAEAAAHSHTYAGTATARYTW
ncbi:MAG: autotransporter domain-containing protein [Rhodoplanes sp.]|uniref:autotransporter domain-containing protein n=1 Tax=Rhodoplanes sp. TaxID=1968906 RepID=UPI00181A1FAF|nr:autotransporter domain-containing protein [Rhodoplanes sp.]NVO12426.1 autotransporter domain-containing protein [Rhodoplanes sp.]